MPASLVLKEYLPHAGQYFINITSPPALLYAASIAKRCGHKMSIHIK